MLQFPSDSLRDAGQDVATYQMGERRVLASDPHLSHLLASAYEASHRPLCLCREGGVPLCVVKDGIYFLRRMPHTGVLHHPTCEWYEPPPFDSGLGYFMDDALIESATGVWEVRTNFPLQRSHGHASVRGTPTESHTVSAKRPPLTLLGLLHLLWDRAQFNRWSPAMQGKRHWGVIRHYALQAAASLELKGVRLSQRLFMPEPFRADQCAEIAARREAAFAMLLPQPEQAVTPLLLLIGELKGIEEIPTGYKAVIKHLPDCPFFLDRHTGSRILARFADGFKAHALLSGTRLVTAFTFAMKSLDHYQVDTLTLMTTTDAWIPFGASPEKRLVEMLVEQGRRFIKPLDYDAPDSVAIPDALLLDSAASPLRLHVISGTCSKTRQRAKAALIAKAGEGAWVWNAQESLSVPTLPTAGAGGDRPSLRTTAP